MTAVGIIWAAALSVISFLAANTYTACLLSLPGSPISNLTAAFSHLPSYLIGHGPLSLEAAALATGLVAACSVWCAWAWSLTHGTAQRQGEEHGSARWGTVRGGRRFMNTEDAFDNIILTEHFGMAMSRPDHDRRYERNRNVLVVGGSGSGKTRGFFEPNVMQMSANYLITDPKGESLPRLGHMLDAEGYRVLSFNTVDFSKSLHYNPIAYIQDEADILEFVTCLIDNTTGDKEHAGDPFWENAERLLYVALIGYLVYHCPPEDRSLSGLVTLLSLAKAKESDEDYRSPLDLLFEEVETGMRYVKARDGQEEPFDPTRRVSYRPDAGAHRWVRVSEPTPVDADFCLLHYKMFKDAAGKTLKSILVSCNTRMEPFAIPQVRELVSYDEMELDRLGDEGERRAIFAVMSDTSSLYSFLFAIMMWQTMNILCKRAIKRYGGALPTPVVMLMDEFANIGQIPNFDKLIATIRSREISASIILQSQSQLKAIYKDAAEIISDNCDCTLFLSGRGKNAKEIAEVLGKETIDSYNQSENRGAQTSHGLNYQKLGKELMSQDEIATMDGGKCILQVRGVRPFFSEKYDITRHPRYKYLSDADKKNTFDVDSYLSSLRRKRRRVITEDEPFDLYDIELSDEDFAAE